MRIEILIIVFLVAFGIAFGIAFLNYKNNKKAKGIKLKMKERQEKLNSEK